jgi:hypothetical protein
MGVGLLVDHLKIASWVMNSWHATEPAWARDGGSARVDFAKLMVNRHVMLP